MPRTLVIAAALVTLALPAQAEENSAQAVWSLFADHCTKFIAVETPVEISAAFRPHETEVFVTPDGAIQTGTAQIEDIGIADTKHGFFQTSSIRLAGGVLRHCTLQIIGDEGTAVLELPALVQEKAAEILGSDHSVQGGPIVTTGGPEGATLYLAAPGFPPDKAIQVLSTKRFLSISLQTMTAE